MPSVHEQLTEQFRTWELRGRGWRVFETPVYPEPPFIPFHGHYLPETPVIDDGRQKAFLGSLIQSLSRKLNPPPPSVEPEPVEEPEPQPLVRDRLIELHTSLPAKLDISKDAFEQFLRNLALCHEPIAFELMGSAGRVNVQFATGENDAPHVRRQLQAYFPEVIFQPREGALEQAWESCPGDDMLVVEFGLAREFMLLLASGKLDPFIGIIGSLSELAQSDLGLFQVLFQQAQESWAENILRSVTHDDGKPFFVNQPELAGTATQKVSRPLYAAVVRIATKGETFERALAIARELAASLRVFAEPQGNELIPLTNEAYPFYEHIEDVLRRQSRRSGMLLNSDELIGFVHLPSSAVRSKALERDSGKTKAAPPIVRNPTGLLLGNNVHFGESIPVRLTPEQRVRHCHIIGASGTGKSTLLFNLIRQDIENNEGVAVLDPHGDLVDRVLGIIPSHRINDVIVVDPADEGYSVGFNILYAHSALEKNLLSSDLVSVFQRISTSWGDQMQSVLQNTVLAFLNSSRRGTLADLRRFLVEPSFRTEFLKSVEDSDVLYYWQKGFQHLSGNKSIGPILTRLEMFLAQKPIRHMVSQPENRLDFGHIMDSGKIFLAKLPSGLLGRENSYLLGALIVSKFQQIAMSRQAMKIAARRDYWLYIDEFANFITPSMAEILSATRKYRFGLTLAHQELHQLARSADVASAVMSHPFTRIVFRVGDDDAKKLAESFSYFEARDLKNLETGQAIARVERSDSDFNLSVALPPEPDELEADQRRQEVITASREKYATPRKEIEALLRQAWDDEEPKGQSVLATQPVKEEISVAEQVPTQSPTTTPPPLPKVIPSETKPAARAERKAPAIPPDLGRGGAQHQAIQKRIKKVAEELGFLCVIEKQILGGLGSVDLHLERSEETIACEISISTTIDHEVGNVVKCLKAGFSKIAVICLDEKKLRQIAAAVSGSLGSEVAARVSYFHPDQFITHLQALPSPVSEAPEKPGKSRRRTVRRSVPKLTLEEQRQREDEATRVITETLRKRS
jgi:hypothetical protein